MRDVGYVTQGPARGQGGGGHPHLLGEALHHAGAERDAGRPRLPPVRPREPAGPRRGHRHHGGAGAGRPSRRRDRPPPPALRRRLPERADLGPRRVHPDGLGDRRREDGRPGLAHADGVPGGGPLDLAAVVIGGGRQVAAAQYRRPMPASASSSTCRSARWRGSRSRSRAWSRTPTSTRRRAASRRRW